MTFTKKCKNIIVASESPDLYTTKRLMQEADALKYQNSWVNPYTQMTVRKEKKIVKSENLGLYFHRTTGIRYDDFDLLLSEDYQDRGYKITNPLSAINSFRNKEKQTLFFSKNNISHLPTISYRGELTEKHWEEVFQLSVDEKYVLKMARGNQGIGVNLVNGKQSLKSLLETFHALKDQKFIIQPFIEHIKEWRFFVIKNDIVASVERTISAEDFRGNSKRNFGVVTNQFPPSIGEEILRAAKLSGLDYCGIDVIVNDSNFYILEINCVPGFEQIEKLSTINIARELLLKLE